MRLNHLLVFIFLALAHSIAFGQENLDTDLDDYYALKSRGEWGEIGFMFKNEYFRLESGFGDSDTTMFILTMYISSATDFIALYEDSLRHLTVDEEWIKLNGFVSVGLRELYLPNIYRERAGLKFQRKDYHGAKADFEASIVIQNEWSRISEENAVTFFNIGLCEIKLGSHEAGCLSISKAGELGMEEAYAFIAEHCNR